MGESNLVNIGYNANQPGRIPKVIRAQPDKARARQFEPLLIVLLKIANLIPANRSNGFWAFVE
jgi:hypothetical protein